MRDLKMFLGWMVVVMLVIGFIPSVANADGNSDYNSGHSNAKYNETLKQWVYKDGGDYFYVDTGANGSDGADGVDGYTPIKGVDYFDGKDGKEGTNGTDGEQGIQGETGARGVNGAELDMTIIVNLENLSNAGTASSFAMTQASNRFDDGFRLGLASFNGQSAIALGGRQDDVTFGLSIDTQDNIGVSFGFDF